MVGNVVKKVRFPTIITQNWLETVGNVVKKVRFPMIITQNWLETVGNVQKNAGFARMSLFFCNFVVQ